MIGITVQFIIFCWIIVFGYWIFSSFSIKRTIKVYSGKWQRFAFWSLIFAIAILSYTGTLSKFTGPVLWQNTFVTGIIADSVTLIGLIIMLWARKTLGANWSGHITLKENHELIENGPYAFVRHPIYSGLLLLALGPIILHGHLYGLLAFIIFFGGVWFRTQQEEKLLTDTFPQNYPVYKKRTKRLIPLIL